MFEDVKFFEKIIQDMFGDDAFFDSEIICADSVRYFKILVERFPSSEVGLKFCGEVEISNGVSVIIPDIFLKLENPEETVKTYQKVVEMRELDEYEKEEANKARLLLKKLFEVFFRNRKSNIACCLYYLTFFGINVFLGVQGSVFNMMSSVIFLSLFAASTSPLKYFKEVKKILTLEARKEKLMEYFLENNMLNYVDLVSTDENIQLYLKQKKN